MGVQHLRPRKDIAIVIETPEGLIRIQAEKHRGLRIECPGEMVAHLGEERALKNARFVRSANGDGLAPKHNILKSVTDKQGLLVGLVPVETFAVSGDVPVAIRIASGERQTERGSS